MNILLIISLDERYGVLILVRVTTRNGDKSSLFNFFDLFIGVIMSRLFYLLVLFTSTTSVAGVEIKDRQIFDYLAQKDFGDDDYKSNVFCDMGTCYTAIYNLSCQVDRASSSHAHRSRCEFENYGNHPKEFTGAKAVEIYDTLAAAGLGEQLSSNQKFSIHCTECSDCTEDSNRPPYYCEIGPFDH